MDLTFRQIKGLIEWARKHDIEEMKVGDISVRFGPQSERHVIKTQEEKHEDLDGIDDINDDDILFWSS